MALNPVTLPGLGDASPVRQNTAIRQLSERLENYAPLASPVFTGDPQAPTPSLADNDTSIATTAYVQGQNYTTKSYVDTANATQDTAIAGKAALVHTHAQSDVTGLVTALAGKEPTITAGTSGQYWRGDKTFQTLPAQKVVSAYIDASSATTALSTALPYDNTIPQSSEGTQVFSRSVTTSTATQVIDVKVFLLLTNGGANNIFTGALFNGTTCIAATSANASFASIPLILTLGTRFSPASVGSFTISVRVGNAGGNPFTLNAALGGVQTSAMFIDVIEP